MGSSASNMFSQNPMKRNFQEEEVPAFKIVIVGDSSVGKSSIFLRFTKEQFDYSYQPTMNVNIGNITKKVQTPFETLVSLTLWDVPGREEIDLRRSYYKDIDAAIVVVDLSDRGSIDMAGTWKQDILNNTMYSAERTTNDGGPSMVNEKLRKKSMKSQMQIPILLVGNKLDKIGREENDDDNDNIAPVKELQLLEETAVAHGFVGCVAVSARDSDGGVHGALRSLMRYLLQKKLPNKVKQKKSDNTKLRDIFNDPTQHKLFARSLATAEDHHYEPLKICKIPELDEIFKDGDDRIKQVEMCSVAFLIAIKNFKKACCVSGITDNYKASMEECVTGIKDALRDGDEDVLVAVEDVGYIQLEVNADPKKIPGPIKRVLDIYENEVCKRSKRVLTLCPTLKINLTDSLKNLETLEKTIEQLANDNQLSKKQLKITMQNFEDNKTRIVDTIELANESMKASDDQYKKVKNAMMW